jgi:D-alanyl-D-alanine carboxypeptidase
LPKETESRSVTFRTKFIFRSAVFGLVSAAVVVCGIQRAAAEAQLLIEADTGKVLHAENATYPWYPASLTKLMTLYVTLRALKDQRLALDTLIEVTNNAVAQAPSKMGFKSGTKLTVDNAIKMMMVKSANDMAVTLAEGVAGSPETFTDEMNRTAQRLGMTQTSYVNPNGLPADGQVTSARDLGILARSLIRDFPEYDFYWHIPAMKFGKRVTRNFNPLIERYPGADGMKTGFICASGFNLVASATRHGKRLIAVVLGAPSSPVRAQKAAQLLERGFNSSGLSWLTPSLGVVDALTPINAAPPNLRDEMCGPRRKRPATEEDSPDVATNGDPDAGPVMLSSLGPVAGKRFSLASLPLGPAEAVEVFIGPPKRPGEPAATTWIPAPKPAVAKHAAKPVAAKPVAAKPVAAKSDGTKSNETKPAGAKPVAAKPAGAKPVASKPAGAKPAGAKPASAKPKTAAAAGADPWTAVRSPSLTDAPSPAPTPGAGSAPSPRPKPHVSAAAKPNKPATP